MDQLKRNTQFYEERFRGPLGDSLLSDTRLEETPQENRLR